MSALARFARAAKWPRVLIIDDEEQLLRVWTRELELLGLEVWAARSARDAVGVLAQLDGDLDAVACDLHMADGDGMELHRFLQVEYPGLEHRVVFITGGAVSARENEFLVTAANPVLEKPCKLGRFVVLAREWGERRQSRRGNASADGRR
ncbi:MAG TPA: response regulator [Myxococcota bacterium]|nr:response regulator [Myxococcota bacterium]